MEQRAINQQQSPGNRLPPVQRGTAAWDKRYRHGGRKLGPHSRSRNLVGLDYRTAEGQLVKQFRAALVQHLGGPNTITVPEAALVDRCCWLKLRLALFDTKLAYGHQFSQIDHNVYLAHSNTLSKILSKLGIKAPKPTTPKPTIDDIIAEARGNER